MKWNPITRRHFLQGAGGAALMLPLLPSLLTRKAFAALTAGPVQKSFIGIPAFNGLYRSLGPQSVLMPPLPYDIRGVAGFTSMSLPGKHTVYSRALSSMIGSGQISQIIDSSFNSMLPKMMLMQGFDYLPLSSFHHHAQFGNQSAVAGNSGLPPMASIDQVMANSTNFYRNPALKGKSVVYTANNAEMGLAGGGYATSATYQNPGNPGSSPIIATPPYFNPQTLWDQFFGGSTAPSSLRTTLVNQVLADYKTVRNGRTISSADKVILDQHIDFLQQTQQQVIATAGCSQGVRPPNKAPSGADWGAGLFGFNTHDTAADRQALIHAMNSVIVSLISCGLCHSFLGSTVSLTSIDPEDWHKWSHEGYDNDKDAIANATSYNSLLSDNTTVLKDQCLDLAKKLDAIKPDGVTSLLDNSLIACIQEHSKRGHESWGVPIITFGSAGGVFKTGQYIDYRNFTVNDDQVYTRAGFPINQAWANMLQACGVPPSEYEALNKPAFTDSRFTINGRCTGYEASVFTNNPGWGQGYDAYTQNYKTGWAGHDLSGWLPFITG